MQYVAHHHELVNVWETLILHQCCLFLVLKACYSKVMSSSQLTRLFYLFQYFPLHSH